MATKYVQLVLMDKGRVVATPLWHLGVKSDLKPVQVRGAADLVLVDQASVEGLIQCLPKQKKQNEENFK